MSSQAFDRTIHALFKQSTSTPIYHVSSPALFPFISDLHLSLLATFAVYWIASAIFETIDWSGLEMFERHRIHEPEEIKSRNRVTKAQVVKMVLLQQAIQTVLGLICLPDEHEQLTMNDARESMVLYTKRIAFVVGSRATLRLLSVIGKEGIEWLYWWGVPIAQFFLASYVSQLHILKLVDADVMCYRFVLDTWQYFLHRAFHTNKFLYKHFHSVHHRLYVPYSFGALYNHPLEGLVLDSLGTIVASLCAGFSTRQDLLFFTISTAKTIDDHCGFKLPYDPLQLLFPNNADYHDIHHRTSLIFAFCILF